ncbi:exosortase [Alteromonas sp. S167]|uniref:exosortase n=1 Tax=Alteromonas sp. S167 TaxID=3117402 RepID=UPI002FE261E1
MKVSHNSKVLISIIGTLLISLAPIMWAFESTLASLHDLWTKNNETYSHGYILILFVCYALHAERHWASLSPSKMAIPIGFLMGGAWVAGNAVQILLLQQMVVPLIVATLMLAFVGLKNVFKVWLPLLGLYLAIPVMDVFISPLQNLTTYAVSIAVRGAGITAYIENFDIQLPFGTLRVAGGCAGLNYILAGLSIGLFYSYLNLVRARDKLLAVFLIIFLALVGNWIRVFALVMIAYNSEMQSSLVNDHGFFGWVIFAVLVVSYFIFMEWYVKRSPVRHNLALQAETSKLGVYTQASKLSIGIQSCIIALLTAIALVAAPLLSNVHKERNIDVASQFYFPTAFKGYTEDNSVSFEQWGGQYTGYDSIRGFKYESMNDVTHLFVVSYFKQEQGKELIYYANRPAKLTSKVQLLGTGDVAVNSAEILQGRGRVFWFYKIGSDIATSDFGTKLLQLKYAFNPEPAHALVMIVTCKQQCKSLDEWKTSPQLQQFIKLANNP